MTQSAVIRALIAACTLRQALEEETIDPSRLSQAKAQLVLECEGLLDDRECLIPLAFVRERMSMFLQENALAETENHSFVRSPRAATHLRFTRHMVLRLIARLWILQEVERAALYGASESAQC